MVVGIVGAGNLGLSLLKGIKKNDPNQMVYVSKRNVSTIKDLADNKTVVTDDNSELIQNSDIIILALKPYNIEPFLESNKEWLNESRHSIVSVATGIEIASIENIIGDKFDIHRAMPNTASSIMESITAVCSNGRGCDRQGEVESLFRAIGEVIRIDEDLMESATILGACGVAYVLRFMRAMIQGGIEVGFDAQTATKIVAQTMKGASDLIIQNNTHPEQEIDKVTTPKGCTIVGLNEMEHAGFSSALIRGIVTSYHKIAD